MSNWNKFEEECFNLITKKYSSEKVHFEAAGKSDSTSPDVKVYIDGIHSYNMETKMPSAQSGQFVLFPNENTLTFDYSSRNVYPINNYSEAIIKHMDKNFFKYVNAGSRGEKIDVDEYISYSWIKKYYKDKDVKFFITKQLNELIIFPVDKLDEYYNVTATYRMKKSGSSKPSFKNYREISKLLDMDISAIREIDGKVVIESTVNLTKKIYKGDNYSYLFREIKHDTYFIRRLSNTSNSNVIFSIDLKKGKGQDCSDLELFLNTLK